MSQDLNDYEKQRLRELLSGGDTFAHWHSEDRVPTLAFLHGLQQLMSQTTISGDATLGKTDDIVFVDTSAGDVTITLPYSTQGQEYTVVKLSALNKLIVTANAPITVNGATSVSYTTDRTARTFKLNGTNWNHLTGAIWDKYAHGSFTSTQTQSVATIDTPTRVTFNVTDYSRNVAQIAGDGIHVYRSGLYNVQFSCQLTNADVQIHEAALWLRKGSGLAAAVDIPYTTSVTSVQATHGGVLGYHIIAANFFVYLDVDDYIELWWAANSMQVTLNTLPPITTPFVNPGSPSVVVTLSYVSSETT